MMERSVIQIAHNTRYRFINLDIMMPIMDGMEVVKELRKESQIQLLC